MRLSHTFKFGAGKIGPAILSLGFVAGLHSAAMADDLKVTQVSITAPVHPGGTVELMVQTESGASCQGNRQGHYGNDYSIRLEQLKAGPDGRALWRWTVLAGNRPIGVRGVRVGCTAGGRTGTLETTFDVK
jgi:hypothetical protein